VEIVAYYVTLFAIAYIAFNTNTEVHPVAGASVFF